MGTRRIAYICALLGAILFYVLYAYWFSWYLLVLIILLLPFDLLISLPGMLTSRLALSAPRVLKQGSEGELTVIPLRSKYFLIGCIRARMTIGCDDFTQTRRFTYGAELGRSYKMMIDTSHSGVTSYRIKRIRTVSLLGFFSIPVTVNRAAAVLVLPAPVRPRQTVSLPRGTVLRPKPGGGITDEHDLRPYRQGDLIRSIHWKVSAKHDSLIVREPLSPPLHSRLIHVAGWKNFRERDLILGRLMWVSNYLLKLGLFYYIKLREEAPVAEITRAADLEDYLFKVLSGERYAPPSPVSVPVRYTWKFRIDASEDTQ